jgi:peptidoglycan/LPS O-acetylase OafA/YrhL
MSAKNSTLYYPGFDYLRIILATTVAVGHAGIPLWDNSGNLAVQIFFAMSGWLIGGILLRSAPQDLPRFYFNRAARIWIPYFVAIILLMAASLLKEPITAKWLEFFFYKITFVYDFFGPPQLELFHKDMPLDGTGHHFWSITAEEQFYLLAPFLITVMPARIGRSIWFWVILALLATLSLYWNYFGAISLGVLAAVVRQRAGDWHSGTLAKAALAVVGVPLLAATYSGLLDYRIGAPLFSLCLVLLLAQPGAHSPVAAFVGGVSYPMYLNHWIGVFIANAAFGIIGLRGSLLSQISGVVISLAVCAVLYVLVDLQVRRNRARYFTAWRGKIAAATGYALVAIGLIGGVIFALQ